MKTLLCALMLTVTAVSCSGNPSVKPTSPTVSITITDNQGHGVVIPWAWGPNPSCQSIMEEAMQAMDEFVSDSTVTLSVYVTPADRLRKEADRIERHDKALAMWDQAKARCWGKK